MSEFLTEWGWLIPILLFLLTKANRHLESKRKKDAEAEADEAKGLLGRMIAAKVTYDSSEQDPRKSAEKMLASSEITDRLKRAVIDKAIEELAKKKSKKLKNVEGGHPLEQLANAAVKAETKKEKIKRGARSAGLIALKILKTAI